MQTFDNQEAFILASKRVKARIVRAKELKVDTLDSKGLTKLVESLSTAKAIESESTVAKVKGGQEFYIQTLLDVLSKPIKELVEIEYNQATLELGTTEEILDSLKTLQAA